MVKIIKAGIVGGIILFIWSAISWMTLPWHQSTMHEFVDVKAVSKVIHSNSTTSGIYMFPAHAQPEDQTAAKVEGNKPAKASPTKHTAKTEEVKAEPMIFAAVTLEGMPTTMGKAMGISLAAQMIAAFLVSWMLMQTKGLSYFRRIGFVAVFGLAAGIVSHLPYWNWLGFDLQFTLVQMGDLVISWFLAGLAIAKICKRQTN